jgi:hypothetical protein
MRCCQGRNPSNAAYLWRRPEKKGIKKEEGREDPKLAVVGPGSGETASWKDDSARPQPLAAIEM